MLLGDCIWNHTNVAKHEGIFHFKSFDCGVSQDAMTVMKNVLTKKSLTGELSSIVWYAKMWLGLSDDPATLEILMAMQHSSNVFLSDTRLHESLKLANFDLMVCDILTPTCSITAHDILRIPYINVANGGFLGTRYSRWGNTPSPLSYVPEYLTHFTDSMAFSQRTRNIFMHIFSLVIYDVASLSNWDRVREKCSIKSDISTLEVLRASSLYILNWDFILEYPRPVQPNVILAGGMSVRPAQPLPQVSSLKWLSRISFREFFLTDILRRDTVMRVPKLK